MLIQRSRRLRNEHWKTLEQLRGALRRRFYNLLARAFATDDGRRIAWKAASSLRARPADALLRGTSLSTPYSDLCTSPKAERPSDRSDVVIITGRFRSGSTLLWNLFRQAGGFTAYYEPLNERRWFDPSVRGDRTDASHRNVSDYWHEYEGLETLGRFYREDWIRRDLLMDENAWDPGLRSYVDTLIDLAVGRPALQFNRIDFRLPWFRRHYPNATLIHIYRHPRDQWCSSLMGDVKRFSKNAHISEFPAFDRFYLQMWAEDLKYYFPFLDVPRNSHPYQLFYYIWKLSYLFGVKFCDHSIQFESLISEPEAVINELFCVVGAEPADPAALQAIVSAPPLGKWRDYAEAAWFEDHETRCEEVLFDFLKTGDRSGIDRSLDHGAVDFCMGDRNRVA
jgi:Sulfotransferase family